MSNQLFYRLLPDFLLRGWKYLPFGVVNTKYGRTFFVGKMDMEVLKLCNGKVDLSLPFISDDYRALAEQWVKNGLITPCERGEGIEPVQEYRIYENRYINMAHWSITGRCNYKCKHCYQQAADARLGELSHDEIMRIIDELEKCGVFKVSLTGGEPLVRKDFWEIVDALCERHIYIEQIYSNGLLVNEKLLQGLKDRGLDPEINMSFDGTEGWHDWLRGVKGATEIVEKAFRLCREYGFSTAAEMCLHEKNKHTLRDSINFLADLGCREVKTNPISDVGAWHANGYGKSIAMRDLYELYLDYVPHFFEDGKPMNVMLGGFFYCKKGGDVYTVPLAKAACDMNKVCVCGHARNVMYISPEGYTLPCFSLSGMDIQKDYPRILDRGLQYCLTDSVYMKLIETKVSTIIEHNERCNGCEFQSRCRGGCRASALESTPDDILGIDEATCLMFKGGYIDRVREVVEKADPDMKYVEY